MSFYQANLVEDLGLVKKFECKISGFEIGSSVEQQLKYLQSTAHLKGFRKGKAPMNVIQDAYFGKIFYDVINKKASKAISEIAETNSLKPAVSPKVELDAESSLPADRNIANIRDVSIKITYETIPDVLSFDFTKVELERFELDAEESIVYEELQKIAKNNSTKEDKNGVIENGDTTIIDFTGYKDGEKFAGGEAKDYSLEIGSKSFIEGFEDGLLGLKVGDETTLNLKFPDEYHQKDLAGQSVEFKVVVKKVQKNIPATIDDELAKKFGFENLQLLKEDIQKTLTTQYANIYKNNKKSDILEKIKSLLSFDLPPSLQPKDDEKYTENLSATRLGLFLNEYAKKHSIEISSQDFMEYISTSAKMYNVNPKFLFDMYDKNQQMKQSIYNLLYENKIYEMIFNEIPSKVEKISKTKFDELLKSLEHNTEESADMQ